ncbi:sigma factor [Geomicrobium sp. JCM 19038]|uniref:sigma factor n=1 Tax=Geomicrobium sp. JCM 19038 TaxID=1460635 RepID=UPI00069401A1|nr:sigma factor [Geomicrobium sp. JCM 19038]
MTKSIRQQFNFEEIYHQYNPLIKASVKRTQIRGFHEDLMQAGYMALWKAYETHNPEKGPFPAYAKLCVSYELLTYFKSEYTYQAITCLPTSKKHMKSVATQQTDTQWMILGITSRFSATKNAYGRMNIASTICPLA